MTDRSHGQNFTFDDWGVLGQIQDSGWIEGGDSLCWTGLYCYLTKHQIQMAGIFEVHWGAYVRHPDPKASKHGWASFYKSPWTGVISRDQLTGLIAGLIANKDTKAIIRLLMHQSLSLFLFTNNRLINGRDPNQGKFKAIGDFTGPDIWALYIRALPRGVGAILWPLLIILDIHSLLNTFVINATPKNDDNINSLMKLFIAQDRLPTPTAFLARRLVNKELMIDKMKRYWTFWRKQPGMFDLYKERIERL